jgi:hypothetical protein
LSPLLLVDFSHVDEIFKLPPEPHSHPLMNHTMQWIRRLDGWTLKQQEGNAGE